MRCMDTCCTGEREEPEPCEEGADFYELEGEARSHYLSTGCYDLLPAVEGGERYCEGCGKDLAEAVAR